MSSQSTPSAEANGILQTGKPIARADLIEGMAKGMAVLESFDTQRQRLNATLAAERAGITRAAARRHLLTLAHLGYLETDGSYYWLAPKVLRFSGSYLASARLPRAVQPTLNRLAAQTQESFSAGVLDGDEVVVIGRSGYEWKSGGDGAVRIRARVGAADGESAGPSSPGARNATRCVAGSQPASSASMARPSGATTRSPSSRAIARVVVTMTSAA